MKRSKALQPLSHDHYQGLQMATRLRNALATGSDTAALSEVARWFWHNCLVPHFAIEEQHLLPILGHVAPEMADRMRKEHLEIESLVTDLSREPDRLAAFADALAAHIRFEEREVFPAIERGADAETLNSIGEHLQFSPAPATEM